MAAARVECDGRPVLVRVDLDRSVNWTLPDVIHRIACVAPGTKVGRLTEWHVRLAMREER